MAITTDIDAPAVEDLLPPRAMAVLEAIRTRRSHPFPLSEPEPPREVIDLLLEAATHAPNHYLTQPWRFFVFRGDARLRLGDAVVEGGLKQWPPRSAEEEAHRRKNVPLSFCRAPVVIAVAAAPPSHPHTAPWEELAATAACIQSILIAANALGLAAYWRSNGTGISEVNTFLGLEPEAQMVGFVYIGYPDPNARMPEKPRRPHTDFVQWYGWDGDAAGAAE
jgi:nitroreductase